MNSERIIYLNDPFFRQAVARMDDKVLPVLIDGVDPRTMVVTRRTASRVGLAAVSTVKDSISAS